MRILVVGAGATGGYFGARLLEAGCDITFLVRPPRAKLLAENGLRIQSPHGDVHIRKPPTVSPGDFRDEFDMVLLSCKAYDLESAIQSFAPAVQSQTSIIPLLNGMLHLDLLDRVFGRNRVLGGLCTIHATLNESGGIVQLHRMQSLTFGDRGGKLGERVNSIADLIASGRFDVNATHTILHDMWEKWVLIASLAAPTCLMRASIDCILQASGGRQLIERLIDECSSVAAAYGYPPREEFQKKQLSMLTEPGGDLTSSMFRDLKAGLRVEADHIIGDMVSRADRRHVPVPFLRVALAHLDVYQLARVYEAPSHG